MTEQHRDKSVERWLRQTPAPGARSASACLDAETLAAWAEGLLNGPERSSAEAHASGCARCQAMLAVMVRTMPGPPPRLASPLRKWLMMLSPALAAGAAVALWFAVDQRPLPPSVDSLTRDQRVADQPSESARSAARSPAAVPEAVPEKDTRSRALDGSFDQKLPKRDAPQSDLQASKALTDAYREREERAGTEKDKKVASADLARAKPLNERKDEGLAARPLAAPPPPPPAAPAAAAAESVQPAAGDRAAAARVVPQQQTAQNQNQNQSPNQNQNQNQAAPRQQAAAPVSEQVVVTSESQALAGADKTVAGRVAAKRADVAPGFAAGASGFRTTSGTFDVVGPDASTRWRVVDGRTVQRSLDSGATWTNQYSAEDGVTLTAGAAPSSTVCWLVGRGGTIVLTTDGRAWQRVKFPEPVDLTVVTSADARTATVTTGNGRRFATTDGGRSWTPR